MDTENLKLMEPKTKEDFYRVYSGKLALLAEALDKNSNGQENSENENKVNQLLALDDKLFKEILEFKEKYKLETKDLDGRILMLQEKLLNTAENKIFIRTELARELRGLELLANALTRKKIK